MCFDVSRLAQKMDWIEKPMILSGKKLLYIFDASDWDSRITIARAAKKEGAQVTIGLIVADNDAAISAKVKSDPEEFNIVPLYKKTGGSKSISASIFLLRDIRRLICNQKPDVIHAVTLKYSLITALAAIAVGKSNKIYTIAGLGYLYRSEEIKSLILRTALWPLFLLSFRNPSAEMIFQNADDRALFIDKKLTTVEKSHLIKGSGVYIDRFDAAQKSFDTQETPLVLMPTRLVHEKGIAVFIEAAKILEERDIKARFEIAGGLTYDNPRAIKQEEMEKMLQGSAVKWLGRIDNIPEKLRQARLVVYPSYYGEGIPRVLLESCAAGCPVITTDHPGCREVVERGVNGLLVPVKDPQSTAQAIEKLLTDLETCRSMGKKSREKACKEFDIHDIANQTIEVYKHITSKS